MKSALCLVFLMLTTSFAYAHGGGDGSAHLEFDNGNTHCHAQWTPIPKLNESPTLSLEWLTPDHDPVAAPGTFTVTAHLGDKSQAAIVTQVKNDKGVDELGTFEAKGLTFDAEGDWDVDVTVTYTDGHSEKQSLSVDIDND
jgi:hypothetical protein